MATYLDRELASCLRDARERNEAMLRSGRNEGEG